MPADITLFRLHHVIQWTVGWSNSHLHEFNIAGGTYTEKTADVPKEHLNERNFKLFEVGIEVGKSFTYTYDFGDDWVHTVAVEKLVEQSVDQRVPVCLGGARECPPEDIGGPYGYQGFLAAMADPKHPEHTEYAEWIGYDFDPERFDLEETNQLLSSLWSSRFKPTGKGKKDGGTIQPT